MPGEPVCCGVCLEEGREGRYKCPRCSIRYCSVACYKTHGDACAKADEVTRSSTAAVLDDDLASREAAATKRPSLIFVDEDEEGVVPEEKLRKLGESEELRSVLRDRHLRNFLTHLNTTHNPRGFMRFAMREPIFVEFADACLRVIHPEIEREQERIAEEKVKEMVEDAIEDA